ncbi:MAG: flagellar basal-body rod protein FlgG [Solirubrobacteraceae bacterium]|jgi:flagellar basal-body rod protein FlgG|nr:flagellar basal-body rod protein FlgG [Solirubrobacteraceae bacterium]MEA2240559.1 flagellar basal-body rod protein FlgG [Solirubrobacteraceae bacterium]
MLEGLKAAATGMTAQQQRMDALSNDIANVNTTGYKHERVAFGDLVSTAPGRGGAATVRAGAGVAADSAGRGTVQGALRATDEPLDVAIEGDGYLQVKLPDGRTGLTRDGSLHADARGRLTTSSGALLQPPVTLPQGVTANELKINPDGTLFRGETPIGRMALVSVAAPSQLDDAGNGVYTTNAGTGPPRVAGTATTLQQGALEASNVDIADAMVDLMDAQRSFEMASKALHTQDEMLSIANGLKQ